MLKNEESLYMSFGCNARLGLFCKNTPLPTHQQIQRTPHEKPRASRKVAGSKNVITTFDEAAVRDEDENRQRTASQGQVTLGMPLSVNIWRGDTYVKH
ncbi:hypothetical protein LSAT2_011343 [Lamellibrachia satsuma]|nr:hypothetical protein LSAT2_011343 [Lamellibrachia satsuma]